MGASIDDLLDETGELQDQERAREAEEAQRIAEEKKEQSTGKKKLTPEQEAAKQQELVQAYGYVEEEDDASADEVDQASDAVFIDPRALSKKARKKAEQKQLAAGVDLLMLPNMNAAIVKGAELQRRKEDSAKASAKREKDKADLKKQKDDAAKKLLDKQKKAQKGERKA
ncbi:BZ3500_MvSof-1268-A1-R1_Chr1-3g02187 [Microbotryum saponariae]|uniref:BZ3500_MvSof-1268-A1-R1_Chr1-3g02187 protein n=1 Tax=Microbotryum saponariae TaxID=289078 RepID=A0A2X0MFM4_9BASI|nr:BZ3500_MvSof-1268-A1-R1_Chr1-3g02187 [Microbotryum saponariae]SCZ95602.1 BZ3501_MvSof-1269-A2-R1_Chr1-3g01790 [Microbotryum saponariae]